MAFFNFYFIVLFSCNKILHLMLSNLKILDFTTLIPGPFATMILADLGAEVLSIVNPKAENLFEDEVILKKFLGKNKKELEYNLKEETSVQEIYSLISEYDIILEGFRPGVMERLGLSYEKLKEINPRIIYCSITGYGQTGPLSHKAGHDLNFMALSGIASYTGSIKEGPFPLGIQVGDVAGGSLYTAIAILSAVNYRQITGIGQYIDVSMSDCTISLALIANLKYLNKNYITRYEGDNLNGGSYYGYYRTKDGRYFSVGSIETKFFGQLLDVLEIKYTGDKYSYELKEIIRERIADKLFEEWKLIFAELDICVEPVLDIEEVFEHPHFISRQISVSLKNGSKIMTHPIKYSQFKPRINEEN